ncbi:MAG: nucleotide sugar dehydrogenase [Candidatus Helarchaeota archaeon]
MDYTPDQINSKFKNGELVFTVVGMGRIGQPTASIIGKKGVKVYGYDIDKNLISILKSGRPTVDEPGLDSIIQEIITKNLLIPIDTPQEAISHSDVIIVSLPTPITLDKIPDYSAIIQCFKDISQFIKKGSLIIIESTVSPGTVENLIIPTIEKHSNLKVIQDFGIASCPERANPGEIIKKFNEIPRIIGGINKDSTIITACIYKNIVDSDLILVSNPKTANAVKLTENIFRDVNIALMNELAILFEKLEIDIFEIINAASTKWNFVPHFPGAGVGGPCLPANPYYLIQEAIKVDYVPHLIRFAREINDRMPHHLVELVLKTLNIIDKSIKNSNIAILGLSYKPNIADYQLSPTFPVVSELLKLNASIKIYDPFFEGQTIHNLKIEQSLESTLINSDCIVIITDHDSFKNLDLSSTLSICNKPLVIVDGRNTLDPDKLPDNVIYRSIGRLQVDKSS